MSKKTNIEPRNAHSPALYHSKGPFIDLKKVRNARLRLTIAHILWTETISRDIYLYRVHRGRIFGMYMAAHLF